MQRFGICLAILFVTTLGASAQVDHWETVVNDSAIWHYWIGTSDPGSDWTSRTFDDGTWLKGRGGFGYGDGDDRTVTPDGTPSVFLRREFQINDPSAIGKVYLSVDYDDGFVAYLNGVEIKRANIDAGVPAYNQGTPTDHEALIYQGIKPDLFEIDPANLVAGFNVLTVEVHNVNTMSSDLSSNVFVIVGLKAAGTVYYPTPSWFVPPTTITEFSSNLPIIVINTNGRQVYSDAQFVADMGLIDNAAGVRNNLSDTYNSYNGKISIELHGESTQMFPKKSYHIETQTATGDNLDAALAGLSAENDWILYAPYSDKSLMRNFLAYTLGKKAGRSYAPRFKFVEMILNGQYNGIYMLVEKIKQDKNRVNISKLKTTDVAGDDVTGGYILRVDKLDPDAFPPWSPSPSPHLANEGDPQFQFQDPKGDKLVQAQRDYIENFIFQMESNLSSPVFTDPTNGITKFIDLNSFIDFMLVTEVSKSVDGYVYSTYMNKDKNSKGGKLNMGPLWDFDIAFGNVNYNQNSQNAPGWTYDEAYRMFWFRRLMTGEFYADSVKCRWQKLRPNYLGNAWINNTLDSMAVVLGESQARNFQQWPIIGQYVWPNQFIGTTFQSEVNYLKTWVNDRLNWMDTNLPGTCKAAPVVTGLEQELPIAATIYPNPTSGHFKIQFQKPVPEYSWISVYNTLGQVVVVDKITVGQDLIWSSETNNSPLLLPGVYVVEVRGAGKSIFRSKLIKR